MREGGKFLLFTYLCSIINTVYCIPRMTHHFLSMPLALIVSLVLTACACDKKPNDTATASDSTAVAERPTHTAIMPPITHENKDEPISLGGQTYIWTSSRASDDSQAPITFKGNTYYDNSIRLHIRSKGQEVFDRTFKKSDFLSFLSPEFVNHGLLINLVGVGADQGQLRFIATVGYPDGIDDENVQSIIINISPSGAMTMSSVKSEDFNGMPPQGQYAEEDV